MRPLQKHSVAVVFANIARVEEIRQAIRQFYDVSLFVQSHQALAAIAAHPPRLVILGQQAGPEGGVAFLRRLRSIPVTAALPVLFLGSEPRSVPPDTLTGEPRLAFVRPPFSRTKLVTAVAGLINADIEGHWQTLPDFQRRVLNESLNAFQSASDAIGSGQPLVFEPVGKACEAVVAAVAEEEYAGLLNAVRDHDNYSFTHSVRVGTLLALFGHVLGLSADDQLLLAAGGLLHDVGKICIEVELLNKPGTLSPPEREIVESHVVATTRVLREAGSIASGVLAIASNHHERLDGTGYPNGLTAPHLDELARMSAIVDVFSALTDRRPYKSGMEPEQAFAFIVGTMRTELDMHLLALFREVLLDAAHLQRPAAG